MDLKEHGGLIVSRNNQNEDSCVVLQIDYLIYNYRCSIYKTRLTFICQFFFNISSKNRVKNLQLWQFVLFHLYFHLKSLNML
jgi:hypothetical protein